MKERTNTAKWMAAQGRWQIKVQKDGQRRTFTSRKPGRAGQREANAKADAWLDAGTATPGKAANLAYNEFLERVKKTTGRGNYRPMEARFRCWIAPRIGNARMDRLRPADLQAILDDAQAAGRSRKYIQSMRGDLSAFMRFCRAAGYPSVDMDAVTVPASARAGERTILQPEDVVRLLQCDEIMTRGKIVKDDMVHYYRLAVMTGMRPGELLGLTWADVQQGAVLVRGSVNIYGEHTRGKNDNAIRRVNLTSYAQREFAAQWQLTGPAGDRVFRGMTENGVYQRWRRFCDHNGITQCSLYELRHTFVSMVQASLPEGLVKSIVGHSQSMDTFGVYGHLFGDQSAAEITGMEAALRKLRG